MSDIPTFEESYNHLVDEGVWLEEQSKVQGDAYKRCPLCMQMAKTCTALMDRIAATLKVCDREIDGQEEESSKEAAKSYWQNRLAVERQWYDVVKEQVLELYSSGHSTEVIKAHPDMKRAATRPSATKVTLSKGKRKSRRQAERKARQRGRNPS